MLNDLCFEIIQTCPNCCKFCSSNSSQKETTMISFEIFQKTIQHFLNHGGIKEISFSGGEPLLHPKIDKMIWHCKENGIRTVLFTSGIKRAETLPESVIKLIKKEMKESLQEIEENEPENQRLINNVKKYYEFCLYPNEFTSLTREECNKLKKLGLDKIVFDWQALEEDTDNELMGRKKMITCLMSSVMRAQMSGLNVDIHFIPMKPNYKQFPDILECLEYSEVKNVSILNFVPQGRGRIYRKELMLNEEELIEFSGLVQKVKEKFHGNIRIGIPLNGRMQHLCTAGTQKLDIKYDGTVLPCPAFKEISIKTMEKYGIKLYNIYEDLEKIAMQSGTREVPLCKQVYGFTGRIIDEER